MATQRNSVDLVDDTVVRQFARAAVLAALIGVTALVGIPYPLSPAPVTLQVLFVFLAGLVLGPAWGRFRSCCISQRVPPGFPCSRT